MAGKTAVNVSLGYLKRLVAHATKVEAISYNYQRPFLTSSAKRHLQEMLRVGNKSCPEAELIIPTLQEGLGVVQPRSPHAVLSLQLRTAWVSEVLREFPTN